MSLISQYNKAMISGDIDKCIEIEQDSGMYGYPPEIVSIALVAIDQGEDHYKAVDDYLAGSSEIEGE